MANKALLHQKILARLAADQELLLQSARAAHAEATDEQNKAENKYDTRALEASYLAQGQANRTAGVPVDYATSVEIAGIAWPVLAKSYDGRPIKLEGNPSLPFATGSNAIIQARVLELYDPDRSRALTSAGKASSWTEFSAWCGSTANRHASMCRSVPVRITASVPRSAASKARKTRRRISVASSIVFRPGAYGSHSAWPK